MSENQDGNGEWAASESKDWKDGRHRRDNQHVLPHAGETRTRQSRQFLTAVHGAFERSVARGWVDSRWPEKAQDSAQYRSLQTSHATEGYSWAVEGGDAAGLRAYVGSQEHEPDISSIRTNDAIRDLLTGDAAMTYIFGHMGNGKSMFASLMAELWLGEMPANAMVASNTRTIDEAEWVSSWPELQNWMLEDEETVLAGKATPKLFIFDEANSHASGRGKDGWDASTKLATMCYKIRKHGGSLIVVGHDGKDIHPAVRELCTAFHKTGTKTGQFYRSVSNRKGQEPITEPLTGIPMPDKSWQPNTYDLANWSWGSESDESEGIEGSDAYRDMALWTIIKCKEQGLSNRETAKYVPYSHEYVRTRYNEFKDDDKHADVVGRVEGGIA